MPGFRSGSSWAGWKTWTPLIREAKIRPADYNQSILGMGKWPFDQGASHSWFTMMGIGAFYVNQSMFAREGLKVPDETWTWEQAVDVARRLTRPGQQWGLQIGSYEQSLIFAYGGQILNEEGTKSRLDQPASIKAHQFWADLFLKHRVSGTSAEFREAGVQGDAFAAGRIGMYLHSSYQIGRFRQDIKDFQWDVVPLPKGPAGRAVMVSGNPSHTLSATGKHKDRAWEFLRWWIGTQNHKQVVLPGNTPTRLAAARQWIEEEKKSPPPQSIALVLEGAQQHGKRATLGRRWPQWSPVWTQASNAILAGNVPTEQALREATQQIDRILMGQ